ncbi:MAG: ComEA family DNA-binding protein [Solobacterium sp.]|nr:ComEA family DNA-binding protein [Solobacterium sp.]
MRQLLIFIVLLVLAAGIDYQGADISRFRNEPITITVTGEVETEGPLSVAPDTTIREVLEQVGVKDTADCSGVNPELKVHDHDVLNIPSRIDEETPLISINSADQDALIRLPGIGMTTADRIISYRQEHGLFQSIEDLKSVKGIGDAKYNAIKDQITL